MVNGPDLKKKISENAAKWNFDLTSRALSRLTSLVTGPLLFKALGLQTKNGPVTRALTYT